MKLAISEVDPWLASGVDPEAHLLAVDLDHAPDPFDRSFGLGGEDVEQEERAEQSHRYTRYKTCPPHG